MKQNTFKKFIYLAAVQVILISQLLVIAVALTTNQIYAESGSGSEGTVTEESTSGSGSTQDSATTDTQSNSGTGNGGDTQQAPAEETAGQITDEEEPAPVAEEIVVEEVEEPVIEEVAPEEPVAEEPVVEEPVAEEPVIGEEAAAEEATAVEEPAPEEPVIGGEEIIADGEAPADVVTDEEAPVDQTVVGTTDAAIGEIDPATGFPVSYQDQTGTVVVPCLDGSDPNCVLPEPGEEPGFDPSQPTELGTNFPSEFFYWIVESDKLDTSLGGKTFLTLAVEGAFVNEEPAAGDEMVFGRIRITGTSLQPNSLYTVTHPYGVDTYLTNEEGIITRGEGTEDIGACEAGPCDFTLALDSRIFQNFLSWDNGAPEGYLGDGVTLHTVTGSPTGNNFFRIEGAGLPEGGLFTDLFVVAGKLLSGAGSVIGDLVGGGTPAEEPVIEEAVTEEEEEEEVVDEELVVEDEEDITDSNSSSDSFSETAATTADNTTAEAASTSTSSGTDNSNQDNSSQTQATTSNSSDNNSGNSSSGSTSGTTGGSSESEQRGLVAEGEIAGVDEEQIAADGISDSDTLVLGAFSEDLTSETGGQTEQDTVVTKEQTKPASTDPLEILLALAALAIAGGLVTGSAIGNLKLQRYLDFKRVLRFR